MCRFMSFVFNFNPEKSDVIPANYIYAFTTNNILLSLIHKV